MLSAFPKARLRDQFQWVWIDPGAMHLVMTANISSY